MIMAKQKSKMLTARTAKELRAMIWLNHRRDFILLVVFALLMVGAIALGNSALREVSNEFFAHKGLGPSLGLLFLACMLSFALEQLTEMRSTVISTELFHALRVKHFVKLDKLQAKHFKEESFLLNGTQKDVTTSEVGVSDGYLTGIIYGIIVATFLVLMFFQSPYLAIIPMLAIASLWVPQRKLARWREKYLKLSKEAEDQRTTLIQESIRGHIVLKTLPCAPSREQEYIDLSERLRKYRAWQTDIMRLSNALNVLIALGTPGITFYLGEKVIAWHLPLAPIQSTGFWTAFSLLQGLTIACFGVFSRSTVKFEAVVEELHHAFRILKLSEEEDGDDVGCKSTDEIEGRVSIRDLKFTFPDELKENPDEYDLEIEELDFWPRKVVIAIGDSGSGKSTLSKILLRLFSNYEGEVSIDGVDIRKYKRSTLRQVIGLVSQDAVIFSGSILKNLALASANVTYNKAFELLSNFRLENLLEFGINSPLPKLGNLSGGEKQRVSIARTFFQKPRILILDEHTSALAPKNEKLVQKILEPLYRTCSALVIAHKYVVLRNYLDLLDKGVIQELELIVMEKGKILQRIQIRTEDDLLKAGGPVAQWISSQLAGDEEDSES